MKKKIQYFVPLLVLLILTIASVTLSASLFTTAMYLFKSGIGEIFGGIIVIAFFALGLLASLVLSFVMLGFSLKSYKTSESKIFPLICSIISIIVIVIVIVIIAIAAIKK